MQKYFLSTAQQLLFITLVFIMSWLNRRIIKSWNKILVFMLTICEYEQIINRSANQTMIVTFMEYMHNYKNSNIWNRKSLVHLNNNTVIKKQQKKNMCDLHFFPSQAIHTEWQKLLKIIQTKIVVITER